MMSTARFVVSVSLLSIAMMSCIVIDHAYGQLPSQCLGVGPGCPAQTCIGPGGQCVPAGGGLANYMAFDDLGIRYNPCGPGVVNNCPNPNSFPPYCTRIYWGTYNVMTMMCSNDVCSLTFTNTGC